MTLIINKLAEMTGKPALHIFIGGVSHYHHLPNGGGKLATEDYGMKQLSSTALSAFKFYQWITDPKNKLPLPIASCRLLLSPSAGEKASSSELTALDVEECNRKNFARELLAWQKDASKNKDDITIFYFAGHGIQNSQIDTAMLLDDFGDPDEGPLAKTAGTGNIFRGMMPPAQTALPLANIARKQFYFIDCCRNYPSQIKDYVATDVPKIFQERLEVNDNRIAPIFFAALPGTKAYALQNEQTFFSKVLIECLNGAAGDASMENDENGNPRWHVSVQTLNFALSRFFNEIANLPNTNQEFSLEGKLSGDCTINWLDGPPMVKAKIRVNPALAVNNVRVEFVDLQGQNLFPAPDTLDNDVIRCRIQAGFYRVNARIEPPHGSYTEFLDTTPRKISPPIFEIERKVG
jgi:hypothetical protein